MSAPVRLRGPSFETVRFALRESKSATGTPIWLELDLHPEDEDGARSMLGASLGPKSKCREETDAKGDEILFRVTEIIVDTTNSRHTYGFTAITRESGRTFQAMLDRACVGHCGYTVTYLDKLEPEK